jgi:hypothetical protein
VLIPLLVFGLSREWSPRRKTSEEKHDEQDHEDEKEDFRDSCACGCEAAEAEYGGDYRNDEEYKRPVQHGSSPFKSADSTVLPNAPLCVPE